MELMKWNLEYAISKNKFSSEILGIEVIFHRE